MPPSEQALDDLRPSDKGEIGACLVRSLDVRNYTGKPNPQYVYLDSMVLHKYAIAAERDLGVRPGVGTLIAV
jgi:hypothetical protein